jgi:hypothetical protein
MRSGLKAALLPQSRLPLNASFGVAFPSPLHCVPPIQSAAPRRTPKRWRARSQPVSREASWSAGRSTALDERRKRPPTSAPSDAFYNPRSLSLTSGCAGLLRARNSLGTSVVAHRKGAFACVDTAARALFASCTNRRFPSVTRHTRCKPDWLGAFTRHGRFHQIDPGTARLEQR